VNVNAQLANIAAYLKKLIAMHKNYKAFQAASQGVAPTVKAITSGPAI